MTAAVQAPGPAYPAGPKLGVDVGTVRVGLAGSDRDGLLAMPIRTLARDARKNADIRAVVREAAERGIVEVFVGLPKNLSGRESESAAMAREYADLLAEALRRAGLVIPVRLIDERLSTVSAHRSLRSAGIGSRGHRKLVDQVAAVEILQHAIDMQRSLDRDVGDPVPVRQVGGDSGRPLTFDQESVISANTFKERDQEL
ncbi:Holliday junction resolvase RuvX [Arthrobacter sp. Br18]|uniref:Holliday junction resolvase RuvX n=1 Tax=Arthrobacter sp. Br18 TaxID=1312954 RepID=UPI0004798364|nr:Holliday junction resolvase RuvX [Arthrobacter sp. Br18]